MNSATARQLYKGFEKRVIARKNSFHHKYGSICSPVVMAWCAVLLFLYVGIFMTLMVIPRFSEDAEHALHVHEVDRTVVSSAVDAKKQADAEALTKILDSFPAARGKNGGFDWSKVLDLGEDGRDLYGEPLFWVFVGTESSQKDELNALVKVWAGKVPAENLVFVGKKFFGVADNVKAHKRFVSLFDESTNIFSAWSYILSNYRRKWYVRADLYTVFVTDNLYAYLQPLDERLPWYLGRKMITDAGVQYASARAGYVLSNGAAGRLSVGRLKECEETFSAVSDGSAGDRSELGSQNFAMCLLSVGVFPEDTRNWHGREIFHPYSYAQHKSGGGSLPSYQNFFKGEVDGANCCPVNHTVSFNYRDAPGMMSDFLWPPLENDSIDNHKQIEDGV